MEFGNIQGCHSLGRKPLGKEAFNCIEEKVTARISGWQWRALFLAGRASLPRFVLVSIPLYRLSRIHVLNSISNEVENEYGALVDMEWP